MNDVDQRMDARVMTVIRGFGGDGDVDSNDVNLPVDWRWYDQERGIQRKTQTLASELVRKASGRESEGGGGQPDRERAQILSLLFRLFRASLPLSRVRLSYSPVLDSWSGLLSYLVSSCLRLLLLAFSSELALFVCISHSFSRSLSLTLLLSIAPRSLLSLAFPFALALALTLALLLLHCGAPSEGLGVLITHARLLSRHAGEHERAGESKRERTRTSRGKRESRKRRKKSLKMAKERRQRGAKEPERERKREQKRARESKSEH